MDNGRYYIGTDLKFKITLTADGFDQSRDDYDIDFYCGTQVKHYNQSHMITGSDGFHYLCIKTDDLAPGMMKMVITAHIPDRDFSEGVRKEIESITLGPIKPAV